MYQVVIVYAGQRLLQSSFRTLARARDYAEERFQDAPIEVVNEHTGLLSGTVDERGWRGSTRPERRPVESV